MYAIMNPANSGKVQAAISEELQGMLADGVTDEELKTARNGWLETQKVDRSDDAILARLLNATLEAGRDMAYYANLEKSVEALTAGEVGTVWKRNVNPDRIPSALAGDMSKAQAAPSSDGK